MTYNESMRHGYHVINAEEPTPEVRDLLSREEDVDFKDVEGKVVPRLRGYTVEPRQLIEDPGGRFDGYYIGEESHGMPHPELLIPPEDVEDRI